MDMIEAIYCLSRPDREERRVVLRPQLARAFAGGQLPTLPIRWWSEPLRDNVYVPTGFDNLAGYYAATVAHRLLLEDAWKNNFAEILVLEDDARLDEEFYRSFTPFMEEIRLDFPDWLAVWLGGLMQSVPPVVLSDRVLRNKGTLRCHAYVVNRHGIARFLDVLYEDNKKVVDWAFMAVMREDDCIYSPTSWQVGTTSFPSDNVPVIQRAL